MKWLDSITGLMDINLSQLQEIVKDRGAWSAVVQGVRVWHNLVTEQQQQYAIPPSIYLISEQI